MPETGWICPSCGRGVAPGVTTCDHGNLGKLADPPQRVLPPHWPVPVPETRPRIGGCDACRYTGICMCVRRSRITMSTQHDWGTA